MEEQGEKGYAVKRDVEEVEEGMLRNTLFTSAACCIHCTVELDLKTRKIPYGWNRLE